MPISLIVSYTIFSFFGFYQKLHIKNFRGSSQGFLLALNLFTLIATLFGIGFLIYYGFSVSWVNAGILIAIAFAIKFVWFPLEAKIGIKDLATYFSLLGFLVMPICGVFMWLALP